MSGIETLPDNNENDVLDNGFISAPDQPILNVHSVENSQFEREGPVNTEENMTIPCLSAISVRNSPLVREGRINTEEN